MMDGLLAYTIVVGLAGAAAGVSTTLFWVLVGDMRRIRHAHRQNRIDEARARSGNTKPSGLCVPTDVMIRVAGKRIPETP